MEKGDKIFFQKKIIYLDYVERENKIKNGGVIKWEARGEESRVQIHIRGLYPTDSCRGELMLLSEGEGHPADTIYLQYGTAEYAGIWHNENLAGTGIPYEGCDGIIIKLSETRFLRGIWRNREKQKTETPETVPQNESEPAMLAAAQTAEESMAVVQTMGPVSAAQTVLDAYDDTVLEPQPMPGNEELRQDAAPAGEIQTDLPPHEPATEIPQPMPETEEPRQDELGAEEQPELQQAIPPAEEEAQSHEEESAFEAPFLRSQRKMQAGQISPNKWEQLNRIYPKIQPFGDVREYLSIAPCDFVILSEHYQEMVQNSFLLHGYYNYGHLILTKIKEGIDDNYYLGVPGVYYEREKQAALLFGFEGFEGDGNAVQDGSFGYYMKRVEI
ncbi:MAG: DUF6128 domain-containing protein [Lachnospiraceae bacterium]|nr:DUF6128 domain-containing protein [Clostridium sp.]MDY4820914.1 DUF6128 domain-containing protein [Lachnospiraceae bacterium]